MADKKKDGHKKLGISRMKRNIAIIILKDCFQIYKKHTRRIFWWLKFNLYLFTFIDKIKKSKPQPKTEIHDQLLIDFWVVVIDW